MTQQNKKFTAFFEERKAEFSTLEEAMDWVHSQALRYVGMTGPSAEERGLAQIF